MRNPDKTSRRAKPPESPKHVVAKSLADRAPFDRTKTRKSSQRAIQAADRLLKEMDDVLKQLERKR